MTQNDTETTGTTVLDATCDGAPVRQVRLANAGLSVALLTRGAILHDLRMAGVPHSLTVGSPDLAAYDDPLRYFGAVVGPVANRIANGTAVLNGTRHEMERNEGGRTTLHSGAAGTHAKNWEIDTVTPEAVVFSLNLRDGDGGFPGNRAVGVRYALLTEDTLEMVVTATTDADTWINFASHGYWNMDGTGDLTGHSLTVAADRYLPTDETALVTGEIAPVAGSGFDFRTPRAVGPDTLPRLDHNFCLSDQRREPVEVLTLTGASGLSMHVATSEPGVQIYDAAGCVTSGVRDHAGRPIGPFCGLAIEPQGWPDAPNQRAFPSIRLKAGMAVQQITRWRFER